MNDAHIQKYMYICIYVYRCTYMYICIHLFMYVRMSICICKCFWVPNLKHYQHICGPSASKRGPYWELRYLGFVDFFAKQVEKGKADVSPNRSRAAAMHQGHMRHHHCKASTRTLGHCTGHYTGYPSSTLTTTIPDRGIPKHSGVKFMETPEFSLLLHSFAKGAPTGTPARERQEYSRNFIGT